MAVAITRGMWRSLGTAVAVTLLAAGCGGSVEDGSTGNGGAAGGGSALSCAQLGDSFSVTISPAPFACEFGAHETKVWEASGTVTQATESSFELDTCPPNADCMQNLVRVSLEAKGLSFRPSAGAFLHLRYDLIPGWQTTCTQQLSISNLPTWGGATNPVSAEARLLFAGSDGRVEPPDTVGFSVEKQALGCFPEAKSEGHSSRESFALVFTGDGEPITVGMGQTATFIVNGQPLTARNQRSFLTGQFDDYWDWSWWVVAATPTD